MVRHGLPQGGHHLTAQDDIIFDLRIPQIQVAVFQPCSLIRLPAAVDREGELRVLAAAQHLHTGGEDLHLTGGELWIFAVPLPDGALHRDGGFLGDGFQLGHLLGGLRHHLSRSVKIPDHGEGQFAADLPDILQPAADFYLLPGVGEPQLSAGVGSILHHDDCVLSVSGFCRAALQAAGR